MAGNGSSARNEERREANHLIRSYTAPPARRLDSWHPNVSGELRCMRGTRLATTNPNPARSFFARSGGIQSSLLGLVRPSSAITLCSVSRVDDLAVLGLGGGASLRDIRAAYRSLALRHHPDLGGDPLVMASISDAYQRILDPEPKPRSIQLPTEPTIDPEDTPDDFTIGHSMLAFVVVPVILTIILLFGVFSVLSTIL